MKTDIQIAQECQLRHITEIAKTAGVDEQYIEQYGRYKAKVDLKLLSDMKDEPNGKLILVTAINPTPAGEGKTTTTVGLADGLKKLGKENFSHLAPSPALVVLHYSHPPLSERISAIDQAMKK